MASAAILLIMHPEPVQSHSDDQSNKHLLPTIPAAVGESAIVPACVKGKPRVLKRFPWKYQQFHIHASGRLGNFQGCHETILNFKQAI